MFSDSNSAEWFSSLLKLNALHVLVNHILEKEYIDEKRKNIKELKAILSVKNGLNFEKSPFPEEKDKNGWNTLAWFTNRRNNKIILETISEIMNIK